MGLEWLLRHERENLVLSSIRDKYIKRFLKVSVWVFAVICIYAAVWLAIFYTTDSKQEFTKEKTQNNAYLMCNENFTLTQNISFDMTLENPTGGVEEEEEVVEPKPDDYTGIPVKLTGLALDEFPEWNLVLPPINCPYYTQKYHAGHKAVDLVNRNCNGNDWVVAVDDGIITFTGWRGGYGYRVELTHENGFVTTYSHLSSFDVEVDDEVTTGQKIGTLGTTGSSSGIHLHFEVIYNGVKINPMIYLGG